MRAFLTGGAGWFGSCFRDNQRIPIVAQMHRDDPWPEGEFECVIHAAPCSPVQALDFAERHGCKNFLFLSSGAVYGQRTEYAINKRRWEAICHDYSSQLSIRIVRLFTFIGPHMPLDRGSAASDFIADWLAIRPIKVKGEGTVVRSYLYMDDAINRLWDILLVEPSGIYDVGSTQHTNILDLALTVADGDHVIVEGGPSPERGYLPGGNLNRYQTVNLKEAVLRTKEWFHAYNRRNRSEP